MNSMKSKLLLASAIGCLSLFGGGQLAIGQTTVYVSTTGSPGGDGSETNPVESIQSALDLLANRTGGDSLILQLAGGTYRLTAPIVISQQSPAAKWKHVEIRSAAGEQAVLSGNRRVSGNWERAGQHLWRCKVDDVFNQLFINGERAVRARYPNAGEWLEPDSVNFTTNTLYFGGQIPKSFAKVRGAELHATGMWHWNRQYIERFDSKAHQVITVTHPGSDASYTKIRDYDRVHFENAKEFLDMEGEWYLDRKNKHLYYYSSAKPTTEQIEYPVTGGLLELLGNEEQPIRDFVLNGITFEGTDWDMTAVERKGLQAGFWATGRTDSVFAPPAAVSLEWVINSRIINCTFRNLGEGAISLGDGSSYNAITDNQFTDVGSNVIQVGFRRAYLGKGHPLHLDYENPNEVSHHNLIRNNRLENFGTTDLGAVGIWVGYSHNNRIDHNEITNFPYSGISVGWYWGTDTDLVPTNCHHNTIGWNKISNGMRYLSDGAGIYLVGNQPGTVIHDNYVYDIGGGYMITSGIYVDEGGANMTITGNYFNNLFNDHEAHAIKLHKNAIPTMTIFNNGGAYRLNPIGTNPSYKHGKHADVEFSTPEFTDRYGIQSK